MNNKKKNVIKYILLGTSIILIIITIFLFIKFKSKDNNTNQNNNKDTRLLSSWTNGIFYTYQDDSLIDKQTLDENIFLLIAEKQISICSNDENLVKNCIDFPYTYKDNKLSVDTNNYFLSSGDYTVNFEDNYLSLEKKNNNIKEIYKFSSPMG